MSSSHSDRSVNDRIRALREELCLSESVNLGTASRSNLVLNQERLRGALADSLRLIDELRRDRPAS